MVREPVRRYAAAPAPTDASDGERRSLIDLLGPTPVAVDELVRQSGQAASTVQLLLLELELAGRVERHAGAGCSALPLRPWHSPCRLGYGACPAEDIR